MRPRSSALDPLTKTAFYGSAAARSIRKVLQSACERDGALRSAVHALVDRSPVECLTAEQVLDAVALLLLMRPVVAIRQGGDCVDHFADDLGRLVRESENLADVCSLLRQWRADAALPARLDETFAEIGRRYAAVLPESMLYEALLGSYDRNDRLVRGVFHTPGAISRWMVAAVDFVARQNFHEQATRRYIDPACGCGTYLAELLDLDRADSADLVPNNSATIGFEVMPATWRTAQWLLAARAKQLGAAMPRIHWANPLLDGEQWESEILGEAPDASLPIIVGNPPYSNFGRLNRGPWMDRLLDDYRRGLDERKPNLSDDFIKFIRWGQHWIDRAGQGVLAYITSNTFVRGLTQRAMRRSLLDSFSEIYVLDLHGSANKRDRTDDGEVDENVFGIRSGVAISLFIKRREPSGPPKVQFFDLRGSRRDKLQFLAETPFERIDWQVIQPQSPNWHFAPLASSVSGAVCRESGKSAYATFWPLTNIFREWISGVQTKNDARFVAMDRGKLAARISQWLADERPTAGGEPVCFEPDRIQPYAVAPLDRRWLYYDPRLLGRARWSVMRHMLKRNVGLVFMRQSTNPGEYDHFLAVDCLASDRVFYSAHGAPYIAPLWLYDDNRATSQANFTAAWTHAVQQATGLRSSPYPDDLFGYLYAVAHRSDYRQTFAESLKTDYPRLPLPKSAQAFQNHAELGRCLVELHTSATTTATAPPSPVDSLTIGGYPVMARWQKQRRGRTLSAAEQAYESRLREVLEQTHFVRTQIDILPRPW